MNFTEENTSSLMDETPELLVVRRTIKADVERVFKAWTEPDQVRKWWGPKHVVCTEARIDLQVGGKYYLENRLPDGSTLHITGEFELILPPEKLVYTWQVEVIPGVTQRVTVQFIEQGDETEVVVVHALLPDEAARDLHLDGWIGCLEGLEIYLEEGED